MRLTRNRIERGAGFTLLEALIALVVFSVALLGLAAMYTKTLSLSHSSYLRSLASIYARDLEERIHANPGSTQGTFGAGVGGVATDDSYHFSCDAAAFAAAVPAFNNVNTPDQVAALDRQAWCAGLGGAFGATITGATVVANDVASHNLDQLDAADIVPIEYTITLQWNERGLDADNQQVIEGQSFVYTVRRRG